MLLTYPQNENISIKATVSFSGLSVIKWAKKEIEVESHFFLSTTPNQFHTSNFCHKYCFSELGKIILRNYINLTFRHPI